MPLGRFSSILVPALCVACCGPSGSGNLLCGACLYELEESGPIPGEPPEGISSLVSCAAHEGVARSVLAAFKFKRLLDVGQLISSRMVMALPELAFPESDPTGLIIPVPASPVRRRLRGFDAAEYLAIQIAGSIGWRQFDSGVLRRVGSGRQRGRGRIGRLGSPPDIRTAKKISGHVLLVDDVTTTGATLAACAAGLLSVGAGSVSAVTFTTRL